MALSIKDGAGSDRTLKTSTDGSDLVPHHIVDSSALPSGAATSAKQDTLLAAVLPTLSSFRNNSSVNSTAVAVKASAGELWGFNIINLDTVDIFVKLYNVAAGSVNPASDVPVMTLQVPRLGSIFQEPSCRLHSFATAIAVRAVTGSGDTNTSAPGTLPIVELKYV